MARLTIALLGPLEVRLDGEPVAAFHSDKVRALLAYLAIESGRPHRRESLAALLWPDYPDRSAHTNLSNALSHLRTTLGDRDAAAPCLAVDRDTVQLDPAADLWVDVTAFERLVAPGPAEPQLGPQPGRLAEGGALYRGPFLEGFSLPDSPPFEQWALVTRERLQRQAVEALGRLSAQHERRGELEAALACARRQLALAPWQEGAHQAVMRLLALDGRRADALAQYEACARALRQELDVEPSEETVTLYQRIRDGTLQVPLAAPPLEPGARPEGAAPKHNLPLQLTPFVGREGTLREIEARLADPACRLLTLVGLGGSGKTRLALEAAARQSERFAHGVFWVPLAALQTAEGIVPAIAQALGLLFQPASDPRQQLLDYLRSKQMLLLLDNFEHLLPAAGLVNEILRAAPGVKVLATSRARLGLQGAQLFPVAGMSYPALAPRDLLGAPSWGSAPDLIPQERGELGDALQYSAVQLFLSGARRVRPEFDPRDEDLAQVVRICRLVEGMPLAILLAAAWMEMLAPDEIAAEIERSLDFLASDLRDVPERQASVRAAFDHSWRLLTEREQEVFAALSVFRGGCTREAAQQVTGASLRELMALVDRSLLGRTQAGRYEMHELLRQYAGEQLDRTADGGQGARDRHAAYYAAALEQWAQDLKGPRQQEALQEIEADIGNARAAWEWAAAHGQAGWLAQGIEGLGWFYDWHRRDEEGEAAFQAASAWLLAAGGGLGALTAQQRRVLAWLWAWQGHFARLCGQVERARELLRQSLELLAQLDGSACGARRERAFALWMAGELEKWSGDVREARSLLEHSVVLYRALGARWETASALTALGEVLQELGFYEQAAQVHRETLATWQELGDQRGLAVSLRNLGWVLNEQGDFEEAERLLRESLTEARTTGVPFAIDLSLALLCDLLKWQGRFVEACSLLEDALTVYRERADSSTWERVAANLGGLEVHLGQYAEARPDAQRGLDLARKTGFQWQIGAALLYLGKTAMAEGDPTEAGQRIQEALHIYETRGTWAQVIEAHAALGEVALLQGDLENARQHLSCALHRVTERRSFIALQVALPVVARLLAEQGQTERAVEIYALASCYGYVANSRWYQDLVGAYIEGVAAGLPPEVVQAAQARGRARDVWATVEELAAELADRASVETDA